MLVGRASFGGQGGGHCMHILAVAVGVGVAVGATMAMPAENPLEDEVEHNAKYGNAKHEFSINILHIPCRTKAFI